MNPAFRDSIDAAVIDLALGEELPDAAERLATAYEFELAPLACEYCAGTGTVDLPVGRRTYETHDCRDCRGSGNEVCVECSERPCTVVSLGSERPTDRVCLHCALVAADGTVTNPGPVDAHLIIPIRSWREMRRIASKHLDGGVRL